MLAKAKWQEQTTKENHKSRKTNLHRRSSEVLNNYRYDGIFSPLLFGEVIFFICFGFIVF